MTRFLCCLTLFALLGSAGCDGLPAARGPVEPVTSTEEFDMTIGQADRPVFVDFSAQECDPCQRLKPRIEELAAEYEGRVRFIEVDINDAPRLVRRYNIERIPTILVMSNGRIFRRMGYDSSGAYREALDAALGSILGAPSGAM